MPTYSPPATTVEGRHSPSRSCARSSRRSIRSTAGACAPTSRGHSAPTSSTPRSSTVETESPSSAGALALESLLARRVHLRSPFPLQARPWVVPVVQLRRAEDGKPHDLAPLQDPVAQ